MADLLDQVREVDFTAQLAAAAEGPSAVERLAPLLAERDEEVRHLAVLCIAAAGGPQVASALLGVVDDEDDQVAMDAARMLRGRVGPDDVPALLNAIDWVELPEARQELVLALGQAGGVEVEELRSRRDVEGEAGVRRALTVVLAKLGNEDAREQVSAALAASRGTELAAWLDDVDYIGQEWVLPALAPALDDEVDVLRVAVDARPELIQALRACDLAVNQVWALVQGSTVGLPPLVLPFAVDRATNYSAEQRAVVRRYLAELPSELGYLP